MRPLNVQTHSPYNCRTGSLIQNGAFTFEGIGANMIEFMGTTGINSDVNGIWSVSFFFNPSSDFNTRTFSFFTDNGLNNNTKISLHVVSGYLRFSYGGIAGITTIKLNVASNFWNHIGVSFDGNFNLWINGTKIADNYDIGATLSTSDSQNNVTIGDDSNSLAGSIYGFQILGGVLTQGEVNDLMFYQANYKSRVKLFAKASEQLPYTALDSSGNEYHGLMKNVVSGSGNYSYNDWLGFSMPTTTIKQNIPGLLGGAAKTYIRYVGQVSDLFDYSQVIDIPVPYSMGYMLQSNKAIQVEYGYSDGTLTGVGDILNPVMFTTPKDGGGAYPIIRLTFASEEMFDLASFSMELTTNFYVPRDERNTMLDVLNNSLNQYGKNCLAVKPDLSCDPRELLRGGALSFDGVDGEILFWNSNTKYLTAVDLSDMSLVEVTVTSNYLPISAISLFNIKLWSDNSYTNSEALDYTTVPDLAWYSCDDMSGSVLLDRIEEDGNNSDLKGGVSYTNTNEFSFRDNFGYNKNEYNPLWLDCSDSSLFAVDVNNQLTKATNKDELRSLFSLTAISNTPNPLFNNGMVTSNVTGTGLVSSIPSDSLVNNHILFAFSLYVNELDPFPTGGSNRQACCISQDNVNQIRHLVNVRSGGTEYHKMQVICDGVAFTTVEVTPTLGVNTFLIYVDPNTLNTITITPDGTVTNKVVAAFANLSTDIGVGIGHNFYNIYNYEDFISFKEVIIDFGEKTQSFLENFHLQLDNKNKGLSNSLASYFKYIPRDESNQDFDVLGNELENKGKACGT